MRAPPRTVLFVLLLLPALGRAEPLDELNDAIQSLARTSYQWETTVRQRFSAETRDPRPNLNAAIESEGRHDPNGFTTLTLKASREAGGPVTIVAHGGDVVANTPLGWLRRTEMRQVGPDREVSFEGRKVRLSRLMSVALKVTAQRPAVEDLLDLMPDVKECRNVSGVLVAELRDQAVERLWGDPNAKRAPEIKGTLVFKLNDQGLTEYHVVLAIGFPSSRTQKVAWTMQQWTTRFSGIGTTTVEPPEAAVKALSE